MRIEANRILDDEGLIGLPALQWVADHPGTILLESVGRDRLDFRSYLFADPESVITANDGGEVHRALEDLEYAVRHGAYVAGWLSYEVGYAFEKAWEPAGRLPHPLLWFGVYEHPLMIDHRKRTLSGGSAGLKRALTRRMSARPAPVSTPALTPAMNPEDYRLAFGQVQSLIAAGDTYQVNLTFKLEGTCRESTVGLYNRLRRNQRVKYAAFVNHENRAILSCSPELFFRTDGRTITLKPMKGTAPRGKYPAEDRTQRDWLSNSPKDRAENLMIVDMLRNDAGRVAVPGSVRVERFFEIERYETVFQATSTIRARLRRTVSIGELIGSLFPCGSVTGAPKIRTMQIIRELERVPRGIYTGSIGFFAPDRRAVFNVAIRTLVVEKDSGKVDFGVGSGVVHDSTGPGEYAECLAKARFLEHEETGFSLIETIRWEPVRGLRHLRLHLKRLKESAEYFGFPYDLNALRLSLRRAVAGIGKRRAVPHRVRVLLHRNGTADVDVAPLDEVNQMPVIGFSDVPMRSDNRLLFHKTTFRDIYEQQLRLAQQRGLFDVVFRNEKGEITEGTRTNIIVRFGDRFFTPPVEAGLLPGTCRSWLMSGRTGVTEKNLYPDDLYSADEVFICNALRGMLKVNLDPQKEG